MLDTCKVENVMDSWLARDLVENGLDSSGYDTSNYGIVNALMFLRSLYADSCRKCFVLSLCMCCVRVLCLVAFSRLWDCVQAAKLCIFFFFYCNCKREIATDCV